MDSCLRRNDNLENDVYFKNAGNYFTGYLMT